MIERHPAAILTSEDFISFFYTQLAYAFDIDLGKILTYSVFIIKFICVSKKTDVS